MARWMDSPSIVKSGSSIAECNMYIKSINSQVIMNKLCTIHLSVRLVSMKSITTKNISITSTN